MARRRMHILGRSDARTTLCGAPVVAPCVYSMILRTGPSSYYAIAEGCEPCGRCVEIAESRGAREVFAVPPESDA